MARPQPIRRERRGLALKDHDPAATPLVPLFEEYLRAKRGKLSAKTIEDYQEPFDLFCRWLDENGLPLTLDSFDVERISDYADHLRHRPALPGCRPYDGDSMSVFSQHTYLRPLNQLGDYLEWAGWIEINPFVATYESIMPRLDVATRVLKLATPDQVQALLAATDGDDPLALRDRAVLLAGWETGARTQDLCKLDVSDVDLRTGLVTIRGSKGDRDRQVKLGEIALPALARYLGTGRSRQVSSGSHRRARAASKALFLSDAAGGGRNPGGRLTSSGVYQLLSRRAEDAGWDVRFGGHRLRHGLATMLVEANVSLAIVSKWLGQSLETTTVLYAHPSPTAMHRHIGPIVAASLIGDGDEEREVA